MWTANLEATPPTLPQRRHRWPTAQTALSTDFLRFHRVGWMRHRLAGWPQCGVPVLLWKVGRRGPVTISAPYRAPHECTKLPLNTMQVPCSAVASMRASRTKSSAGGCWLPCTSVMHGRTFAYQGRRLVLLSCSRGKNDHGQLGLTPDGFTSQPTRLPGTQQFTSISAGV